jgi:hypothetical protein
MLNFSEKELQQYTKDELIFYMKQIHSYIPQHVEPINKAIMWKRYKDINDKIEKILDDCTDLAHKYNETKDIECLVKLQKLGKKRDKLWAKEKRMQKELFGA